MTEAELAVQRLEEALADFEVQAAQAQADLAAVIDEARKEQEARIAYWKNLAAPPAPAPAPP